MININLLIAGRSYPLKIKPEEEEIVRRAAKRVNEKIHELQEQYAAKDKQDYLAMVALMNEVEVQSGKEKVTIDPTFFDKLREIDALLSDTVSR
ncbi:MAG TPA: cell division protein ZapA [Chitinophagales bacterium]|nr:cell division protein ZapA [Chitinophagales bacterium]